MEDTLIRCLDGDLLSAFLTSIGPIWEVADPRTIIVHANAGDVTWTLSADGAEWCHDAHVPPLPPTLVEASLKDGG